MILEGMCAGNLEVVRRVYDAASRRDSAAVLSLYDADVELDNTRLQVVSGGVYRGHHGLRAFFRQWNEAWESIDVKIQVALLWTLRDGQVTRVVWFPSPEEALEAAGTEG